MKRYGKNPSLLKVEYIRPNKKKDIKECFQVVYIDDDGNVKYTEDEAIVPIYFVKPEYRTYTFNKPEERIERLEKRMVKISEIKDAIAKEAGPWGKAIKDKARAMEDYRIEDQLFRWPYCYGCDFLPEFYFMHEWFEQYPLQTPKLSVAFLDIETDIMDYSPELDNIKDTAYAPINLVSVIMEKTREAVQFVLRPYPPKKGGRTEEEYKIRYAQYEKQLKDHEWMMSHLDEHIEDLHKRFDKTYGHLDYKVREYTEEIDLIADVFRFINTRKPHFCMIWNMRFDIQYFYYRIMALGYDPTSIMCSPEIPNPRCYFREDKSTFEISKQFDFFHCSSFTQYICMMRNYASIRKSQHTLRSVSLNAISDRELRDKKVEYPENANIKTFPYDDWIRFQIYNFKDSLLMLGIHRKTNDIMTYYMRAMKNQTPYNKIFRETHLLRDVREIYFEREGWVQGNNLNTIGEDINEVERRFYEGDDVGEDEGNGKTSFKGAINAEPTMNDTVGEKILGVQTNNLFVLPVDMDMGAFYPSVKIASNMDAITLITKATFNNIEFETGQFPNRSLNQQYEEKDKNGNMRVIDITGEAVNTYVSGNILTFGYNYLGFPNISEIEKICEKELGEA